MAIYLLKSFPLLMALRENHALAPTLAQHTQFYLATLGATHKDALIAALVLITSLSIAYLNTKIMGELTTTIG
jgi:hypothetical protein